MNPLTGDAEIELRISSIFLYSLDSIIRLFHGKIIFSVEIPKSYDNDSFYTDFVNTDGNISVET